MDKHTVTAKSERQLKIQEHGEYIKSQRLLTTDVRAKKSFSAELKYLREQYKNTVPDSVLVARIERLQELRKSINLRTVDNRRQYQQQTARAASKLCGVAV